MGPQPVLAKIRKVVLVFAAANDRMLACDDHNVAFAIRWQLESVRRFLTSKRYLHLRECPAVSCYVVEVIFAFDVHPDE